MKANQFITIAAVAFCTAAGVHAQTWTQTTAPAATWVAIASSADGTRLFASSLGFNYGISTNSGATWNIYPQPQSGSGSQYGSWKCVASSADGRILVGMNFNAVWTSTNSGVSWISNTVPGVNFWASVALSADGIKAVAVDGGPAGSTTGGGIYVSTNSGITWSETFAPTNTWSSVASSADGIVLAAAVLVNGLSAFPTNPVYVSINSGVTWAPTSSPTNMQYTSIASSVDGHRLIVGGFDGAGAGAGMVYTSTNSGNTWISNSVSQFYHWYGVASSADGAKLVVVGQGSGGAIVTSTDSGMTWASNNVANQAGSYGVASSADGTKLAAVSFDASFNGSIWAQQTTPSPVLKNSLENNTVALSWVIPSTNFVLQQSFDLTPEDWSNVTNPPVLNLTNLQNQITLPAAAANSFYRLKTP